MGGCWGLSHDDLLLGASSFCCFFFGALLWMYYCSFSARRTSFRAFGFLELAQCRSLLQRVPETPDVFTPPTPSKNKT